MDKIGNQLIKEVIENHIFEVEKILGKHPNVVNHQNINMWSALIFAAQYGYTECVRLLLWAGADTNIQTWNGWTALMYASRYGYIKCVRLLLDSGANPNLKNRYGETALMYASINHHIECIELLLKAGANPLFKNEDNKTAYDLAIYEDIKKLLKNYMKIYPVMSLLGKSFKKKTGLPADIGRKLITEYLFSKKNKKKSKKKSKSKSKRNVYKY